MTDQRDYDRLSEQELAERIEYHNRKYWTDGEPEISDAEYDLLVRALTAKNPGHPLLSRVEAPLVASSGKITHKIPMLSLDKAYSLEEVLAWVRKCARDNGEPLLVQPKYDGISAIWSGGILATRGDGFTGENISEKAELIELEHPDGVFPLKEFRNSARGEIVIREDDFKTLYPNIRNRNGRVYKNSRNAVAGIMGLKSIREMLLQHAKLTLVDYRLHSEKTTAGRLPQDWSGLLEQMESLPYPMDGIVIKLADKTYSDSLGSTAHHPRGQIAFKFSGVRRESKLLSVEWRFGKNCLTPVAEINPVEIGGTTIRHASLHNLQNVLDRDLQIGDTVTVERAGDVIPYIVSSEPGTERRSCLIEHCPSCGTLLIRDLPELRCPNPNCFETKLKNLASAVKSIGIERLGEPNIRKMMLRHNVSSLSDIFKLGKEDILHLDGFQETSANNLLREIQNARTVPDWQVLASMNIRGIGPNIAKVILNKYSLPELRALDTPQLSLIEGIGPERASALHQELRNQAAALDELLSCVKVTETRSANSAARPGICFTGKMPKKRSFYETLAKRHGFEPADSVTSSLALLVCADESENSSKLKKAHKENIPVQTLSEWLKSLEDTAFNPRPAPKRKEIAPEPETEQKDPAQDPSPEQTFFFFHD